MVRTRILAFVALLLAALPAAAGGDEPYTLQPGDTLFVSVWKEEELSRELVVLPDGTISFPLAGSLSVTGLTPAEAEAELAKKLGKYIPDAEVSVSVMNAAGYRDSLPRVGYCAGPAYEAEKYMVESGFSRQHARTPYCAPAFHVFLQRQSYNR